MAISRKKMQSLFLKDAERQRLLKEQYREQARNALSFQDRILGGAFGSVAGGVTGFVTGGPAGAAVGAASGAVKGYQSKAKGFTPMIEGAKSGAASGMIPGSEGTELEKVGSFIESSTGDPMKAVGQLQQIERRGKAAELEKLRRAEDKQSEIDLEKLKQKGRLELERLKTTTDKPKVDKTQVSNKERVNDWVAKKKREFLGLTDPKAIRDYEFKIKSEIQEGIKLINEAKDLKSSERTELKNKLYSLEQDILRRSKSATPNYGFDFGGE